MIKKKDKHTCKEKWQNGREGSYQNEPLNAELRGVRTVGKHKNATKDQYHHGHKGKTLDR